MLKFPDSKVANIEKNYLIINPPEDLYELKALVEKFNKYNPVSVKIAEDEIKKKSCRKTKELK